MITPSFVFSCTKDGYDHDRQHGQFAYVLGGGHKPMSSFATVPCFCFGLPYGPPSGCHHGQFTNVFGGGHRPIFSFATVPHFCIGAALGSPLGLPAWPICKCTGWWPQAHFQFCDSSTLLHWGCPRVHPLLAFVRKEGVNIISSSLSEKKEGVIITIHTLISCLSPLKMRFMVMTIPFLKLLGLDVFGLLSEGCCIRP